MKRFAKVLQGSCQYDPGKNPASYLRVASRCDFKHMSKTDSKKQGCLLHLGSTPLFTSGYGPLLKLEKMTALIPELSVANG